MIIKVGVDNVTISRFDKILLSNSTFLNRCFTSKEQAYCFSKTDPSPHFAVRFAAKEAVIKALSGFDLFLEHNKIEIANDTKGRPYLKYLTKEPMYFNLNTDISLSHSETSAIAFVIIFIQANIFHLETNQKIKCTYDRNKKEVMNQQQIEKINEIFSDIMGIPKSELNDTITYNSHPAWDSLKHLQLISELETTFDIEFDMDDVIAMENFGLVKELTAKYL